MACTYVQWKQMVRGTSGQIAIAQSDTIGDWITVSGAITISDTGVATLDTETVQDLVGPFIDTGGTKTGITITYQDSTNDIDFVVDHDAATNFVATEHIDHTSVTITAGDGLAYSVGGTDISASATLDVDIANATSATVASLDEILIADVDNADAIRKVTAQSIANLAPGGSLSGLSDTVIAAPAGGHLLVYDGTDSWDNQAITGDITITAGGVVTIGNVEITALDINGGTGISSLAQTDEFVVYDDGVGNRKITYSDFQDDIFGDFSGEVTVAAGGAATVVSFSLSPDNAQIVGTPDSANDAVNKTYVDNAITGISWVNPVATMMLIGNLGEVALEALSPSDGDAYVVSAVDGDGTLNPGAVAGLALGDVVEFNTGVWVRIQAGVAGFVADGTRVALSTDTALIAPYTLGVDDGQVRSFDGTTLTGSDTGEAVDGAAFLIDGENGFYENTAWVFDGTVPTGVWVQFSGAGQINAGTGITKSGNTLNLDLSELSTSGTFTPSADHLTGLDGGSQFNWLWTTVAAAVFGTGFTVTSGVASADFGEVGDITDVNLGQAAAAGATGEIADAGHTHASAQQTITDASGDTITTDATAFSTALPGTIDTNGSIDVYVNGIRAMEGEAWNRNVNNVEWEGASCHAIAASDQVLFVSWQQAT
jgi:hypothetical protein